VHAERFIVNKTLICIGRKEICRLHRPRSKACPSKLWDPKLESLSRQECLCVFIVFLLFSVYVAAFRRIDPRPRSPADWAQDQGNKIAAKAQQTAVEPLICVLFIS
jgi:hypothetical protein